MAKQIINIGTTANDGTGDPIRTAFDKANDNFTELYDESIDGVILAAVPSGGSELIFSRNGGAGTPTEIPLDFISAVVTDATLTGDGTVANPLSATNQGIPEAPTDGNTYGRKDAAWSPIVATLPESANRTAAMSGTADIKADLMQGVIYNADAPSGATAIQLDPVGRKVGAVAAFYTDGVAEPTVSPTPNPKSGTWQSGKVNVYWFMWDGFSWTQNIQTQLVTLPTVDTPTFTLASGATALSVGYSSLVTGNATSAIMEISDNPTTGFESVDASDYTYGDTGGDVLGTGTSFFPLVDGTTYYIKVTSSLSGYNDASATESATASGQATLGAPTDFEAVLIGSDFNLSWTKSTNATNYVIESSTDGVSYSAITGSPFGDVALATDTGGGDVLHGYYRIKATATGFNDSAWAEVDEYGNKVLFYDEFEGSTIAPTKWNIIQGTPDITVSQNNKLIFTDDTIIDGSANTAEINTDGKFNLDATTTTTFTIRYDVDTTLVDNGSLVIKLFLGVGLWETGDLERIETARYEPNPLNALAVIKSAGVVETEDTPSTSINGSWKVLYTNGTVEWFKWNGSNWGSAIYTLPAAPMTGSTSFYARIRRGSSSNTGSIWSVDNVFITSEDYQTELP